MISFAAATELVFGLALPLGVERVGLEAAHGRILSGPVRARVDAPAVDVSAMDGYAVRDLDLRAGPSRLDVIGEAFPGRGFSGSVETGRCVRIFTGAAVPQGADRVVVQEVVERDGGAALIGARPAGGRHIRTRGSDFRQGEVLLEAGRRLDPAALLLAAGGDVAEVAVYRRPRVAVLGTGDELVDPGAARGRAGAVPESVTFGVAALVRAWGGEVVTRRRLPDDLVVLQSAGRDALTTADLVVTVGGASVGDRDFARAMFATAALETVFSKVAIKPGKPLWLGRAADGTLVVGLPGNPTSALVTARLFLAPLLAGLSGDRPERAHRWRRLRSAAALAETGARETFLRAALTGDGVLPLANQDSGAQKPLALTDVLVRREGDAPAVGRGDPVDVIDF